MTYPTDEKEIPKYKKIIHLKHAYYTFITYLKYKTTDLASFLQTIQMLSSERIIYDDESVSVGGEKGVKRSVKAFLNVSNAIVSNSIESNAMESKKSKKTKYELDESKYPLPPNGEEETTLKMETDEKAARQKARARRPLRFQTEPIAQKEQIQIEAEIEILTALFTAESIKNSLSK